MKTPTTRVKFEPKKKVGGPGTRKTTHKEILQSTNLVEAASIVLARRDLIAFGEAVLRDEEGQRFVASDIHRSWATHFSYCWEIGKVGVVLAPYAHGKTQWVALALPLFLLGLNPNLRIMMVSSAEDIAAKRLQKIGDYIVNSDEYHKIFPWVEPDYAKPWNAHALNVQRKSTSEGIVGSIDYSMSAFGYTSSEGQGSRADVLLFDDVADEKNSAISAAARRNLQGLVLTQWMSRSTKSKRIYTKDGKLISNGGIICAIGTRFHEEDIYGFFMNSPEAYCTLVQAVSEDFTHLDVEVIGAVEYPPHPMRSEYRKWQAPAPVDEELDPAHFDSSPELVSQP